MVEANLGVVCANLPILKKPINWAFSRAFGSARTLVGPYAMDRTPHHAISRSKTNRLPSKDSDVNLIESPVIHTQIDVVSKDDWSDTCKFFKIPQQTLIKVSVS